MPFQCRAEVAQEFGVHGMRRLAGLLAEVTAGLGELDDAAPPVVGLWYAPDRAQRFEFVEHVDHDAGRHADPDAMATDRTDRMDRMDRVAAGVVIATAAATGFLLIMGFANPDRLLPGAASPAARTLTYYQSVRTVVLVGAAVWLLARGRPRPLRLVLILNAITQSGDAVIGLAARHSAPAALGPACFAAALA